MRQTPLHSRVSWLIALVLGHLFVVAPITAQPLTYFVVQCEPHTAADAGIWGNLESLVAAAEVRDVLLTIELTPQWADMILADSAKHATLLAWQASGHEIGAHHHQWGIPTWDGYSSLPGVSGFPDYEGDMNDFAALLSSLVGANAMKSLGNPSNLDWPVGMPYRTTGNVISDAISVPTYQNENGQDIWNLDFQAIVGGADLADLIDLYPTAGEGEVFGVATHVYNYVDDPTVAESWFDFLATQDPGGLSNRTVSQIMAEVPRPGDFDANDLVDLFDHAAFFDCMTGPDRYPIAPGCVPGDFDHDGDSDLDDFGSLAVGIAK